MEQEQEKKYKGNLPPEFYGQPTPGRPKGKRNFLTDFREAWRIVAQQLRLNEDVDEGVKQILIQGIKQIMKGNPTIYKEFMERFYGKVKDEISLEGDFNLPVVVKIIKEEKKDGENNQTTS